MYIRYDLVKVMCLTSGELVICTKSSATDAVMGREESREVSRGRSTLPGTVVEEGLNELSQETMKGVS